jgi:ferredoxin-type protein NapG
VNRRRFFREGLRELLRPLADATEPIAHIVRQLEALEGGPAQPPRPATSPRAIQSHAPSIETWLRPPGALPEDELARTCTRGGECVRSCPAQAIRIDITGTVAGGLPHIFADDMPCVVCDSLACMHNCPSGALVLFKAADIDMGTAVWNEETCIRTRGQTCTLCVDQCPIGPAAIQIVEERIVVIEAGCTGCGVCQNYCPTNPKSIKVVPTRLRDLPVPAAK